MAVLTQELTYEEIHRLKAEQERLIAAGKMERPKIIKGLSAEGLKAVEEGVTLDILFDSIGRKYGFI